MAKPEKTVIMSFRISKELNRLLRIRAATEDRRIQEVCGDILRAALEAR